MKKVKKEIYAGNVLEVAVYHVTDGKKDISEAKPRLRFKDDEERMKHREGILRRRHARSFNATFDPSGYYSTFTFSGENEVHDFDEAKDLRRRFYRAIKRRFPNAILRMYLGRGKTTKRIHLHMVSMGVPKEWLEKNWQYGKVKDIDPLRSHNFYEDENGVLIDHGTDYTGLANYLFDHWKPEQGGQHYMGSKNDKKDDGEEVRETIGGYSKKCPPTPPKGYVLVQSFETTYGYQYYKYVREPEEGFLKRPKYKKRKIVDE